MGAKVEAFMFSQGPEIGLRGRTPPPPPSGGLSLVEDPPLAVAERHGHASSSSSFGCRRERTCWAVLKIVDRFERV